MIYSSTDIILCFSGVGRSFYYKTGSNSSFAMDADVAKRSGQPRIHGDAPYLIDSHRYKPSMATEYLLRSLAIGPQAVNLRGLYEMY